MPDVTSGATLVASVMETAGYVTQSLILEDFQDFFKGAGSLLYIIAGIGAVISLAIFGSYRMSRYLFIAPALFWLVLDPSAQTEGVMWRIGGGSPRTIEGRASAIESAQFVRQIARNTVGHQEQDGELGDEDSGAPRVSMFFNWFTYTINGIVNSLVDVILTQEDNEDLLFLARAQTMDAFVNANVYEPEIVNLIRDTVLLCPNMINASLAKSSPHISARSRQQALEMSEDPRVSRFQQAQERRRAEAMRATQVYYARVRATEEEKRITPSIGTIRYLIENKDRTDTNTMEIVWEALIFQDEFFKSKHPEYEEASISEVPAENLYVLKDDIVLNCYWLSAVLRDALERDASRYIKEVYDKMPFHAGLSAIERRDLRVAYCREIAQKMDLELGDCQFQAVLSLFMLRNALSKAGFSKLINQLKDRMQLAESKKPSVWILTGEEREEVQKRYEIVGGLSNPNTRFNEERRIHEMEVREIGNGQQKTEWKPFSKITQIEGHLGAAFKYQQKYQTAELKQTIFSWAMHVPYFQGVMLYLLAVAYPFLALVLVIPGRAQAFLNVPLAWFWIKSWDVGFALVMVAEKVLWNLFPTIERDVGASVTNEFIEAPLPDIFKEALRVDPSYDIHAYFFFISMGLLSVPALTGYAALKAKRSILSSFTDGPKQVAKQSGDRGGGAYGLTVMNQHIGGMRRLGAMGMMNAAHGFKPMQTTAGVPTNVPGVLSTKGRWQEATAWGAAHAGVQSATRYIGSTIGGQRPKATGGNIAEGLLNFADTGAKTTKNLLLNKIKYQVAYQGAFGQEGRHSILQQDFDAVAAALDGGGGFEMNDLNIHENNAMTAHRKLFLARLSTLMKMLEEGIGNVAGGVTSHIRTTEDKKLDTRLKNALGELQKKGDYALFFSGVTAWGASFMNNRFDIDPTQLAKGTADKVFGKDKVNDALGKVSDSLKGVSKDVDERTQSLGQKLSDYADSKRSPFSWSFLLNMGGLVDDGDLASKSTPYMKITYGED